MARSSRSECHPQRREPPPLTLRSSRLTRRLRPLRQRRRRRQHLHQDLDRSLCVPTTPDWAVGLSPDLAADHPSLAVDASLCLCAIRGASYSPISPLPKARSSEAVQARPAISADSVVGSSRMWKSFRKLGRPTVERGVQLTGAVYDALQCAVVVDPRHLVSIE